MTTWREIRKHEAKKKKNEENEEKKKNKKKNKKNKTNIKRTLNKENLKNKNTNKKENKTEKKQKKTKKRKKTEKNTRKSSATTHTHTDTYQVCVHVYMCMTRTLRQATDAQLPLRPSRRRVVPSPLFPSPVTPLENQSSMHTSFPAATKNHQLPGRSNHYFVMIKIIS